MTQRYTVVIPVLNQLVYTRQCVQSLLEGGTPREAILVIDNASTDDTAAWLREPGAVPSVHNEVNLGCGGAWTQGALLALDAEWVVLLNNDIVAMPQAMDAMLDAAERHRLDVVSPALIEGALDYDFPATAAALTQAMSGTVREGWFHGVCFAVRRRVFQTIGFPDTDRQLGGREDVEFLVRCLRSGLRVGTVGDSLLHHFGSITQKAIKKETEGPGRPRSLLSQARHDLAGAQALQARASRERTRVVAPGEGAARLRHAHAAGQRRLGVCRLPLIEPGPWRASCPMSTSTSAVARSPAIPTRAAACAASTSVA
jgi:GT2 family glycosyltransferase